MRAFLAVSLSPPAIAAVAALQDRLRPRIVGLRWAETATAHITLCFFANLEDAQRQAVTQRLDAASLGAPFSLQLQGLDGFPSAVAPRVLWLGVSGPAEPLLRLHAQVTAVVKASGIGVEARAFTPHCTLARLRHRLTDDDRMAWDEAVASEPRVRAFPVTSVDLYQSLQGHHVVQRWPLRP